MTHAARRARTHTPTASSARILVSRTCKHEHNCVSLALQPTSSDAEFKMAPLRAACPANCVAGDETKR